MVNDPEAGVTVTAELRVMILFDRYNELLTVRLNALLLAIGNLNMISLPTDLFRHILSFRDPIYEYTRRFGTPSARWAQEYVILGPTIEYEMINGRVVTFEWDRPYFSVHGYDLDMVLLPTCKGCLPYVRGLPTRASF